MKTVDEEDVVDVTYGGERLAQMTEEFPFVSGEYPVPSVYKYLQQRQFKNDQMSQERRQVYRKQEKVKKDVESRSALKTIFESRPHAQTHTSPYLGAHKTSLPWRFVSCDYYRHWHSPGSGPKLLIL